MISLFPTKTKRVMFVTYRTINILKRTTSDNIFRVCGSKPPNLRLFVRTKGTIKGKTTMDMMPNNEPCHTIQPRPTT